MTKQKSTKRALLMSALALLMCVSMLIGSTFAWFTDSVTSGSNVITAGNLDIVVEYTLDGENWGELDGATDLFQKGLWEPGHTEVVALRIKNNGTLALKYAANMNIIDETIGKTKGGKDIVLSDILTVSTLIQQAADKGAANQVGDITLALAFNGENTIAYNEPITFKAGNILGNNETLLPGDAQYVIVKVDMAETVGNEANHNGTDIPTINFGINVLATQFTYENDSFGNQYDANAAYPTEVYTATELLDAIADGGNVKIVSDITLSEKTTSSSICAVVDKEVAIDLNGHNITSPDVVFYVLEGGKLTINGDGNLISGNGGSGAAVNVYAYGGEVIINGGTYSLNRSYPNAEANHGADMIYAHNGGTITINGGTFKYAENVWTLNLKDNTGSAIVVKGGTFEGFNPANNVSEGLNTNFVADGYVATENNGTWTVTAE